MQVLSFCGFRNFKNVGSMITRSLSRTGSSTLELLLFVNSISTTLVHYFNENRPGHLSMTQTFVCYLLINKAEGVIGIIVHFCFTIVLLYRRR
jgi:hypothetical protein